MDNSEDIKSFANPRTAVALGCISPAKQDRYTCLCCRAKFENVDAQRGHFKTEWHLYNLKRKVCKLDPIDLTAFNVIKTTVQSQDADDASTIADNSRYIESITEHTDSDEQTLDDDWDRLDDDSILDEEYTDDEINQMLDCMISTDTCLFCDLKSANSECNTDHMQSIHGFFLPEEKYLIDPEGMLEYLGLKVGAGATCLWCNKQFTSLHGVRLHMLYKDHCKILYDQESATEFKDYYDYKDQEGIPMKPVDELVIKRRRSRSERCSSSPKDKHRWLRHSESSHSRQQLVQTNQSSLTKDTLVCKSVKKFNMRRAKLLLKTELASNKTNRARFRSQNPI